jgi:hypothetical protein
MMEQLGACADARSERATTDEHRSRRYPSGFYLCSSVSICGCPLFKKTDPQYADSRRFAVLSVRPRRYSLTAYTKRSRAPLPQNFPSNLVHRSLERNASAFRVPATKPGPEKNTSRRNCKILGVSGALYYAPPMVSRSAKSGRGETNQETMPNPTSVNLVAASAADRTPTTESPTHPLAALARATFGPIARLLTFRFAPGLLRWVLFGGETQPPVPPAARRRPADRSQTQARSKADRTQIQGRSRVSGTEMEASTNANTGGLNHG